MKKLLVFIVFNCLFLTGYNQNLTRQGDSPSATPSPVTISFWRAVTAPDLKIKNLTAVLDSDVVVFTLAYCSKKDRFLSLFSPPNGDVLQYIDRNGLTKEDTVVIFRIARNEFQMVDAITMRFSTIKNTEKDRNFIYLKITDPSVKKLLGITAHHNFFSRILPFYSSLISVMAMWLLIPFILLIGAKTNLYISVVEKWITNKWLLFNVKVLFLSIAFVFIMLLIAGKLLKPFPAIVYLWLLLIPSLPCNFVYIIEIYIFKSRQKFWLMQYLNLVFIIIGLYITYILCNNLSGKIITRQIISLEYVFLFGIMVGFIRSINNYVSYQRIAALQEKELEISRLNELKVRSDLNALQSKINPHFLYNALNSIAELCWKDPAKTERMALSLSKLFRYTINKEKNDFNPLKTEIEIVSLYLSIEKERFGDRLNYEFDFSSEIENLMVPKFTLQPIIENAIKHGIAKKTNGGSVKLSIKRKEKELEIKVYDDGPDFPIQLNSGYGLQSIFDKLDILYPKRYSVELYNGAEKNITLILKDGI